MSEVQDNLRINAVGSESQSSDFHPSSVFWWDSRWPLPFVLGNKDWWNMIYFHFTEEQRIGKDVADNTNFYRSCCWTREWSVTFLYTYNSAILQFWTFFSFWNYVIGPVPVLRLVCPHLTSLYSPSCFLHLSSDHPSVFVYLYIFVFLYLYIFVFLYLCICVVLLPLLLRTP